MTTKPYSLFGSMWLLVVTKLRPISSADYVPNIGRCRAASYKMRINGTWIYSAPHFAQVFIVGFIFVFSRVNEKPQRIIRAKKKIYCLVTAEFIDRVCFQRDMNKDESQVKVRIDYSKSFNKASPKATVEYCQDFKLQHSSPSGSAFKLRIMLQAPEKHLNRQAIVYLEKLNEIVDYRFTGGFRMPELMTSIGACFISAFRSSYPDAPLRSLSLYTTQFDKWMKTWRNFQARLNEASPASFSFSSSAFEVSCICFFLLQKERHGG